MSEIEFLQSQKKRPMLKYKGYLFVRQCIKKDRSYWRCTNATVKDVNCRARCISVDDVITKDSAHNHPPDDALIQLKQLRNTVKYVATNSELSTKEVIDISSVSLPDHLQGQTSLIRAMKRMAQRVRNGGCPALPVPTAREKLELPEEYSQSLTGDVFLMFDSGADTQRILIYSTAANLEFLSTERCWYAEGSSICPQLFAQLYTIHAVRDSMTVPLVYAFLPNKLEETYRRFFVSLKMLRNNLAPLFFSSDFEMGSVSAFHEEFPQAVRQGCFYQFSQCLLRELQLLPDVWQRYLTDEDFALNIRMLMSFAFVPMQNVVSQFDTLMLTSFYSENDEFLESFLNNFEDTWIGRFSRGRRQTPRMPLVLWNCCSLPLRDTQKLTKSIEAWHATFSEEFGASKPSFWRFIKFLKEQQNETENRLRYLASGGSLACSANVEVAPAANIPSYASATGLRYLRQVALTLSSGTTTKSEQSLNALPV